MDDPLENAKRELKQWQSIVSMLGGNTDDKDLKALERRWLEPLREKIEELERLRECVQVHIPCRGNREGSIELENLGTGPRRYRSASAGGGFGAD